MKWAKFCIFLSFIAAFTISLVPQDAFSYATREQFHTLVNSVCYGNESKDLQDYLHQALITDYHEYPNSSPARFCRDFFYNYLDPSLPGASSEHFNREWTDRVVEHVRWWGNAKNQSRLSNKGDVEKFLEKHCEKSKGREETNPSGGASSNVVYSTYYTCIYDSDSKIKMTNPYCEVIWRPTNVGFTGDVVCAISAEARDKESENIINPGGSPGNDQCTKGSELGWIFCPLNDAVSNLIDAILANALLPSLQWRLFVP